jgi:heterodisulfide reductase subunit C
MIDSRKTDPDFKFEIAALEEGKGILKCFACGSCTARCPEMEVHEEWNPRLVIRKALLGLKEEVFRSEFVWICSAHYRCLEQCPQGVNVKGVMNQIRNQMLLDKKNEEEKTGIMKNRPDPGFKYRIAEGKTGKDLFECFSCGTCTAGCPERELDPLYSPRKVIKYALLGMKDKLYANRFLEICSTHYRCLEQCPQGVEIPRLMYAIRTLAEKEGYSRDNCKEQTK